MKYPRTYHLPWSLGTTNDDKIMTKADLSNFEGQEIVVTEKLDGENTTMTRDKVHARSLDSKNHPSRNWVKNFWSMISRDIPKDYRICGENMYAKHSIFYENLPSYFLAFSIWDRELCLDWRDTLEWLYLLGIKPVPIMWQGIYDEKLLRNIADTCDWTKKEGYVIRTVKEFQYKDFKKCVGKFVRKSHVTTDDHWMTQPMVQNKLEDF